MNSATGEGECLVDADGHDIARSLGVVNSTSLFAGKVGAVGAEGAVVEIRFAIRCRRLHYHVCVDGSEKDGHGREDSFVERHGVER